MTEHLSTTRLSVNINKIATIRNARGGNIPNVKEAAIRCEEFGAEGITVHPRPDERHITYQDVRDLKEIVTTEYNIEGNPTRDWLDLVLENKPAQATLVPDKPGVLTSNAGWETKKDADVLRPIIRELHDAGIRVSIFINAIPEMAEGAADLQADRIELYTGPYAHGFEEGRKEQAIEPFIQTAEKAYQAGLGINAGHDLNRENLAYFAANISNLLEVSIGHAIISDALYLGLENTIQIYRRCLQQ